MTKEPTLIVIISGEFFVELLSCFEHWRKTLVAANLEMIAKWKW